MISGGIGAMIPVNGGNDNDDWRGGGAIITNKEYNFLALMANDGMLRMGGRPVNVEERGCGRGRGYDTDAVAAAATMMFDAQWVVEWRPPPSSIPPPRTG